MKQRKVLSLILAVALVLTGFPLVPNFASNTSQGEALSKLVTRYESFDGSYNATYDYLEAMGLKNAGVDVTTIRRALTVYGGLSSLSNGARNVMALIAAGENPADYNGNNYVQMVLDEWPSEEDPKDLALGIIALEMAEASYDKTAYAKHLIATGKEDYSGEFAFGHTSSYWDDWDQEMVEDYTPSADYTALAALALASHRQVEGAEDTIQKALVYLEKRIEDNGSIEGDLSATVYAFQALKKLGIAPSSWVSSAGNTLENGIMACYIESDGRFTNSPGGSYASKLADGIGLVALTELINGNSVYDIRYTPMTPPTSVRSSLDTLTELTVGESLNFTAFAYDASDRPLDDVVLITSDTPEVVTVENQTLTAQRVGTANIIFGVEGAPSITAQYSVSVVAGEGLTPALKTTLQQEIDFLKAKYAVYNNYEFLSAPAATVSGMDGNHIADNLMSYSRVNNLALLTKTLIAQLGSSSAPVLTTDEGQVENLLETLRAAQVQNGAYKGQFALSPMDLNDAEYQAWAIIALYMSGAPYDSTSAVEALVTLLDGAYKSSVGYKAIQTEGICLVALGLYRDQVGAAATKADALIQWLQSQQNVDGGFDLDGGYFSNSPMATASVVQGLVANGINPAYHPNWTRNGNTPLNSLLKCKYISPDPKLQGYAKSEEKIGADYKATYHAFAALTDMVDDRSMFVQLRQSPTVETPGVATRMLVTGGYTTEVTVGSIQPFQPVAFDAQGLLTTASPEVHVTTPEILSFSNGELTALKAGTGEVTLTLGARTQTIVFDVQTSDTTKPEEPDPTLEDLTHPLIVQVEGNNETLYNQVLSYTYTMASTPYEVLKEAVGEDNITYNGSGAALFVTGILGELQGDNDGWSYSVRRLDGSYDSPMIGINALKTLRTDENTPLYDAIVFYKSHYEKVDGEWLMHTKVPTIQTEVNGLTATFTVLDSRSQSPLQNVEVKTGHTVLATTDKDGKATVTLPTLGEHTLSFSRYEDGYATLLKTFKKITLANAQDNWILQMSPLPQTLRVGEGHVASATASKASGAYTPTPVVTWRSSNPAVASVDAQGQILGLSAGTCDIEVALVDAPEIKTTRVITVTAKNSTTASEALEQLKTTVLSYDNWQHDLTLFHRMLQGATGASTAASKIRVNETPANPTDFASNIITLVAAGQDPSAHNGRNFIAELAKCQQPSGAFTGGATTENQTIWSIIALDMAGATYDKKAALDYLKGQQQDTGAIGYGIDDTGMYLVALGDDKTRQHERDKALNYLVSAQADSGAIGNPYSTAFALHGLVYQKSHVDTIVIEKAMASLLTVFEGDRFKVVSEYGTDTNLITKQASLALAEGYLMQSAFQPYAKINAQRVHVAKTRYVIDVGEQINLNATIVNPDGTPTALEPVVQSLTPSIVGVASNMVLKGNATGSGRVKVVHPMQPDIYTEVHITVKSVDTTPPVAQHLASIGVDGPNGPLLSQYTAEFTEGENVMSYTERILRAQGLEVILNANRDYIVGIGGIEAFDYGQNSGWKYYIDGKAPNVGAGQVHLTEGMRIEWRYTRDYTTDSDEITTSNQRQNRVFTEIYKLVHSSDNSLVEKFIGVREHLNKIATAADEIAVEQQLLTLGNKATTAEQKSAYKKTMAQFYTDAIARQNSLELNGSNALPVQLSNRISRLTAIKKQLTTLELPVPGTLSTLKVLSLDEKPVALTAQTLEAFDRSEIDDLVVETPAGAIRFNQRRHLNHPLAVRINAVQSDAFDIDLRDADFKEKRQFVDTPLKVTLKLTTPTSATPNRCLLLVDGDKEKQIGGIYDSRTNSITFEINEGGRYKVALSDTAFSDANLFPWAKASIDSLGFKGLALGNDNRYMPEKTISGAEFLTLTLRTLSIETRSNVDGHWFDSAVKSGKKHQLIDDSFEPEASITREEAATLLIKALASRDFSVDVKRASALDHLRAIGLVKGDGNGQLLSDVTLNRAMTAVLIDRLYTYIINH
ncbi:DUF4430 domain-containing protein [Fusibacter sp. JL298sf-3]